jgi:hypothetical protein
MKAYIPYIFKEGKLIPKKSVKARKPKLHKYSLFILLKEKDNKNFYYNGGWGQITGATMSRINWITRKVTLYNQNSEIYYEGINHIDCLYRPFSFLIFLNFKLSEVEWYIHKKIRISNYVEEYMCKREKSKKRHLYLLGILSKISFKSLTV